MKTYTLYHHYNSIIMLVSNIGITCIYIVTDDIVMTKFWKGQSSHIVNNLRIPDCPSDQE